LWFLEFDDLFKEIRLVVIQFHDIDALIKVLEADLYDRIGGGWDVGF
jgi:hypothetical protein